MKTFWLLALLTLGGCSASGPVELFLLDAQTDLPSSSLIGKTASPHELRVGLRPIRLAAYLDRPQMVTAVGEHQFQLDEQHRWAERLDENIERSLLRSLTNLLPELQIVRHPWQTRQNLDQQISIDILALHHHSDGYSELQANWQMLEPPQTSISQPFSCRIKADSQQAQAIVHAQSQCLGRLSMAIATQLRLWSEQKNTPTTGQ